jgi:hypothetical protein
MEGRERFNDEVQKRVTYMFDEILTYAEVAVHNKYQYNKLRGRILTAGNDAIRDLQKVSLNYDISYTPVVEIIKQEER